MSTELAPRNESQERLPALVDQLQKLRPHVQQLGINETRFIRIVINELQRNPQLQACAPASLFGAALLSAQLNLEPGPLGHAWFIPRKVKGENKVVWMLGYRGIIDLGARAGVIIEARSVYEGERFVETTGTSPRIEHEPHANPQGDPIAWYAVATLPDGRKLHRVLSKAEVEKRRKAGSAPFKPGSAWHDWYDAMARKTAIRALLGMIPLTPDMRAALAADEEVAEPPAAIAVLTGPTHPQEPEIDVDLETGEILGPQDPQEPVADQQSTSEVHDTASDQAAQTHARPEKKPDAKSTSQRAPAADPPTSTPTFRPATQSQLSLIQLIAEGHEWDDDTLRARLGVKSRKELSVDAASKFIEIWVPRLEEWTQNRRARLASECAAHDVPIETLLATVNVERVEDLKPQMASKLIRELQAMDLPDDQKQSPTPAPAPSSPRAALEEFKLLMAALEKAKPSHVSRALWLKQRCSDLGKSKPHDLTADELRRLRESLDA